MNKLALGIQNNDLKIQIANLKNNHAQEIEIYQEEIKNSEAIATKMTAKFALLFAEIAKLNNEISAVKEENKCLSTQLILANETIEHLKGILNQDSNNSSKPPSSDGFKKKIHNSREKSGKTTGGQIGHPGRTITYVEAPTSIVAKHPDRCACGGVAVDLKMTTRKQIVDVEIKLNVQEEQMYEGHCAQCNKTLKGTFSKKFVNPVQYGNTLKGLAVLLLNEGMVSTNRISSLISELTDKKINLSEGTIINIQNQLSKQSEPVIEGLKEQLQNASVLNSDETGARVNGEQCWVHVVSNASLSYFAINKKRGKIAMDEMGVLNCFRKTLVHDHWKSYFLYPEITHAECNAHVLRYVKEIIDVSKRDGAQAFFELLLKLNSSKKAAVAKGLSYLEGDELNKIRQEYRETLSRWQLEFERETVGKSKKYTATERCLITRLVAYEDAHLMFLSNFEVPFDNNLAERDLRMIKTKIKVSGGFRSLEGGEAFMNIRSLIGTAKKQGKNVFRTIANVFDNVNSCLINQ